VLPLPAQSMAVVSAVLAQAGMQVSL